MSTFGRQSPMRERWLSLCADWQGDEKRLRGYVSEGALGGYAPIASAYDRGASWEVEGLLADERCSTSAWQGIASRLGERLRQSPLGRGTKERMQPNDG